MISIAMTTYNGEKYIREQVDSILRQTYQDFELIICDDYSKDSTWNILQEYKQKDSRIRCYLNEFNLGFKKNFEKAIKLCTGEFIALSDQDDIWTSDHLEILLSNIQSYSLICSNVEYLTDNGRRTGRLANRILGKNINEKENQFFRLLYGGNFVQGCTVLFHRNLVDKAFPIPEEIQYHDYWLGLIAIINNSIYYLNRTTVLYRQHDNNVTKIKYNSITNFIDNKIKTKKQNIYVQCKIINYVINNNFMPSLYKDICLNVYAYYISTINRQAYIKRLVFFIKYYKIIYGFGYRHEIILLFIPRFIFNMIVMPILLRLYKRSELSKIYSESKLM